MSLNRMACTCCNEKLVLNSLLHGFNIKIFFPNGSRDHKQTARSTTDGFPAPECLQEDYGHTKTSMASAQLIYE